MATRAGTYLPIRPAGYKPAPVPYFKELMAAQNMLPVGILAAAASAGDDDEKKKPAGVAVSTPAIPPPDEDPLNKLEGIKTLTERVISQEVEKLPGGREIKQIFNNVEVAKDIIGHITDPKKFRGSLLDLLNTNEDVKQVNQNYINQNYGDTVDVYRTVVLKPGEKLAIEGETLDVGLSDRDVASKIVSVSTDFETNIKQFADQSPLSLEELEKGYEPYVIKYTVPRENIIVDVGYLSSLVPQTEAMNKKFKTIGMANDYFDEKNLYGEYPEERNRIKYATELSNRQKEILVDVSGAEKQIIPTGRVPADSTRMRIQEAINTGEIQSVFDELENYKSHEDYKNEEYSWSQELSKKLYGWNMGGLVGISHLTRPLRNFSS